MTSINENLKISMHCSLSFKYRVILQISCQASSRVQISPLTMMTVGVRSVWSDVKVAPIDTELVAPSCSQSSETVPLKTPLGE